MSNHRKCPICKVTFTSDNQLNIHVGTHLTTHCEVCNVSVLESKLKDHMESQSTSDSYRKRLSKSKSKKKPTDSTSSAPRLNSFLVFCRAFREAKKKEFPQLNMIGINAILREDWYKLTDVEKAEAATSVSEAAISASSTVVPPTINAALPVSALTVTQPPPAGSTTTNFVQSQIRKCNICGCMFFDSVALEEHKRLDYETENLSLDQVTAPVDIPEVAQVGDGREVDWQKYWLKVKSILWPCRAFFEISINSTWSFSLKKLP